MNALFLLCTQLAVVLSITFVFGWIAKKLGQPRVIGEIAGGIILGPVVMGQVLPKLSSFLFAANKLQWMEWVSNAGLVTFLFLVGSELDLRDERQRAKAVITTTAGSILLPFVLGVAIAPPLLQQYGAKGSRWGFVLFIAVAMSITALPVLARILKDREAAGRPVEPEIARQSLISAALNDALAWCALAAMLAVLHGGGAQQIITRFALLLVFIAAMFVLVRPLLRRVNLSSFLWLPLFAGIAAGSAWVTNALGIHLFFGAFLAGVCAPRSAMVDRVEDSLRAFSIWTLPSFFALTGLRMRPELSRSGGWPWLLLVLAAAVIGKIGGASAGARVGGLAWPSALKIGVLLNTRGLVELIVLNAGYREGILNAQVFTLLVCMALVTTAMTGPLLDVLERKRVV